MPKLIIADTSCLIVLEKIGRLDILKELYSEISITKEILSEFRELTEDWIQVVEVLDKRKQQVIEIGLDPGEASAIALALENEESLLLIDERKGRRFAQDLGLQITGTLGILARAAEEKLIDSLLDEIIKLKNTDFRVSEKLIQKILRDYNQK